MKSKKAFQLGMIFLVIMVAILGLGGIWFWSILQPVSPRDTADRPFIIPKGQAASVIAVRLTQDGIIKHPLAFRFVVWKEGLQQKIQAGTFQLSPSLSTQGVVYRVTKGTEDQWVTIPEGKRVEEIAELFADFSAFDQKVFIQLAKPDEGYLFPDTYLFPQLATAASVHTVLRETFDAKIEENIRSELQGTQTLEEVVILASLVEREARNPADMKIVAGILQNRINIGMALQVDATLQYIKGYDSRTENWWPTPLASDKELESPYNTYKYPGLPPGPISNPGLNALQAAADPTDSEYFYYISDATGKMHYAVSYEEHLVNVNRYLR